MDNYLSLIRKNIYIQIAGISILLAVLLISLKIYQYQSFDIRSSAKQPASACSLLGGDCTNDKRCATQGGLNLGNSDCKGKTICCYQGPALTPTPTPVPRLEYFGENIKVITECSADSVLIYIIDDGVDENPNGTWTFLIVPSGEMAYLAYTSEYGGNSSATIYGTTNPIRGDVREVIQSNTVYTAGIAHGSYTVFIPSLLDPIYQLTFTTPDCN